MTEFQNTDNKIRFGDMLSLNIDWTDEFREEMRERHLRQMNVYFVFVTFAMLPLGIHGIVRGYDYNIGGTAVHPMIIPLVTYALCATVWYGLKKTSHVRALSWFIVVMDLVAILIAPFLFGWPFFTASTIVYPIIIMFYGIYLHPVFATRLFLGTVISLWGLTWLTAHKMVPFYQLLKYLEPTMYQPTVDLMVNSKTGISAIYLLTSLVMIFTFMTLLASNYIVVNLRRREAELSDSHRRITELSEKLRVFLPEQFVESLAQGDRETRPDYRRRKLCVFFSDVQGFTAWTDKLDPEDVRELLNEYLSEMSDIAKKWGGTLDKFIGDAMMVFFGDPEFTTDKDHALRCVKMAMEMQKKMTELRDGWADKGHQRQLHIRVGINTGYATVGNFGSNERLNYTALGSAVNLASRLESNCQPDKITISHTVYSLVKDEIDCEPKGEITVKGFSEPVTIYEVIGLKNR